MATTTRPRRPSWRSASTPFAFTCAASTRSCKCTRNPKPSQRAYASAACVDAPNSNPFRSSSSRGSSFHATAEHMPNAPNVPRPFVRISFPRRPGAPAHGHAQCESRAAPRSGLPRQRASQLLRPLRHTRQAVAALDSRRVEAPAIVGEAQYQPAPVQSQLDIHLTAAGMARRVVQALLENEENLAADVGVDVGILFRARRLKPDLHAVVAEEVAGKPAHAVCQIVQPVLFRVDRPHDVAH